MAKLMVNTWLISLICGSCFLCTSDCYNAICVVCSGSGGRREEETTEEAHFYNTQIGPIIDEMATHIKGTVAVFQA